MADFPHPGALTLIKHLRALTAIKEIAAKDPGTLYSEWTISENGKSVRVDGRYVDATAAMAQFGAQSLG